MLWAARARDGKWKQHDWRWNFDLTFKEIYGNLVLKDGIERPAVKLAVTDPTDSGETRELTCLTQTWDVDFTLDTCIDIEANDLVMRATIPDKSWFAIGFGAKMENTDMIGWHAENGVGYTKDYWSTSYGTPREDASQDVKDDSPPTFDAVTNKMTFVTRRSLDTGDTGEDFLIEPNSILPMSWAYKRGTSDFKKHDERGVWSLAVSRDGVITDGGLDVTELLRNDEYEQHGLWMWGAWFVCGLTLLTTKRYIKKFWMAMQMLHSLLGIFVLLVTVIFAMKVSKGGLFTGDFHNILGSAFMIITILGALTGFTASAVMRFYNGEKDWSVQEKHELVGKIHRYAGYTMLFLGNVTLATGISHYYGNILMGDTRKALGPLSLMVFVLLVAIFETIYRLRNRYSLRQIKPEKLEGDKKPSRRSLTSEEVEEAVKAGQKLVIYDNLVLDTADYYHMHPGGKFNILHNIGRDITKFFNGAYILVNDKKNKPYTHSAAALDIIKGMIIGDLNGQSRIKDEKFRLFDKK